MRRLIRALVACGLVVVGLEVMSFAALGLIALRGGYASTYFRALLPHPFVSRHVVDVVPEVFHLVRSGRYVVEGGKVRGAFEWHPLLGHYGHRLPKDGTPRGRPTFAPNELVVYLLGGSVVEADGIRTHLRRYGPSDRCRRGPNGAVPGGLDLGGSRPPYGRTPTENRRGSVERS